MTKLCQVLLGVLIALSVFPVLAQDDSTQSEAQVGPTNCKIVGLWVNNPTSLGAVLYVKNQQDEYFSIKVTDLSGLWNPAPLGEVDGVEWSRVGVVDTSPNDEFTADAYFIIAGDDVKETVSGLLLNPCNAMSQYQPQQTESGCKRIESVLYIETQSGIGYIAALIGSPAQVWFLKSGSGSIWAETVSSWEEDTDAWTTYASMWSESGFLWFNNSHYSIPTLSPAPDNLNAPELPVIPGVC